MRSLALAVLSRTLPHTSPLLPFAYPTMPSLRPVFRLILQVALPLALTVLPVQADKHVAIKANADADYEATRTNASGEKRVEQYVFLEGRFFPGAIKDRSLEQTEMIEVARALAPHLAKQNFLPSKDRDEADIVIAVHWGMTTSLSYNKEYVMEMMEQARDHQLADKEFYDAQYGSEEASDFAQELLRQSAADAAAAPNYEWARMASTRSERDIAERPMATILGFSDVLNHDTKRAFSSEEANTIRQFLNEERYFVVVMAYDLKQTQKGRPLQRLWVARLSVPSSGINFPLALERLGEAGSDYFGTDQPGLTIERRKSTERKGEVEIGEATVITDDVP